MAEGNTSFKMAEEEFKKQCAGWHVKVKIRNPPGEVEGQIQSFGYPFLFLWVPSSSGAEGRRDMQLINVSCIESIEKIEEDVPRHPIPTTVVNISKKDVKLDEKQLKRRLAKNEAAIKALSGKASSDGKRVFMTIQKTIKEVEWDGDKIVVLGEVTIHPPYRKENMSGDKESPCFTYISKIVDKHWAEMESELSDGDDELTSPAKELCDRPRTVLEQMEQLSMSQNSELDQAVDCAARDDEAKGQESAEQKEEEAR